MAKRKADNEEAPEAVETTPEAEAPTQPETQEDERPKTEAERRALRRAKKSPRQAALPSLWVRYTTPPGQGAGPVSFGPLPSRLEPAKRITLTPGEWTEVCGTWGAALKASKLANQFEFAAKKPD